MTAGFRQVVFIIKHAIDAEFRELTRRVERHIETAYVYQENDVLPEGFSARRTREAVGHGSRRALRQGRAGRLDSPSSTPTTITAAAPTPRWPISGSSRARA